MYCINAVWICEAYTRGYYAVLFSWLFISLQSTAAITNVQINMSAINITFFKAEMLCVN